MLNFIPTPIGNLGDISFRAVELLKEGEYILCEDTRVSKRLLYLLGEKYNIIFPNFTFFSVHSHNEEKFLTSSNIEILKNKNCIYLSDAGMPCVSDPGAILVQYCLKYNIPYDVLPGANALLTAYANSGFLDTEFTFFGFLPHKGKERQYKLEKILHCSNLAILYESPHRLLKLLEELKNNIPNQEIFLVKELTKKYQTRYKDSAQNIYNILKDENIKGEWVILIPSLVSKNTNPITLNDIHELSIAPKQKAKLISKLTGKNIKEIYNQLALKK